MVVYGIVVVIHSHFPIYVACTLYTRQSSRFFGDDDISFHLTPKSLYPLQSVNLHFPIYEIALSIYPPPQAFTPSTVYQLTFFYLQNCPFPLHTPLPTAFTTHISLFTKLPFHLLQKPLPPPPPLHIVIHSHFPIY